ncbi:hypothetical protein TSAR_000993 [Trichomalopsis sarcophagae]|uniref:Reverse transcriptase domain-containing protein n=1 Tax=Trichomalopsis sarcophagae TaxID=543379 RepID=A0A232FHS7_9HYME|nr:hypothetical protein TSAR_000993 [Trichomalopsis sarcophagae]
MKVISSAPFICGHDYIIANLRLRNPGPVKAMRRYRDCRSFDPASFIEQMDYIRGQIDISGTSNFADFRSHALQILDRLAPFIERPIRKRVAPWFNASLRTACKARDKLYDTARRRNSHALLLFLFKLGIVRPGTNTPLSNFKAEEFYASVATCHPPCLLDELQNILAIPLPLTSLDTRPTANLTHFAKIFDKLVTIQLMDFLETNTLLTCYQSGFRKYFNTQSALIKIVENIRIGIEKGLVTILILFDVRKAFDSISHIVLLRRMREMNFSENVIRWFHLYLSDRSQSVLDLNGLSTEFLNLSSGIPQGSNPGPVAFLIFINTVVRSLFYCRESCMLFADDFQIYLQCTRDDLPECLARIDHDADGVDKWAIDNDIHLNAQKPVGVVFGFVQNLMRIDLNSLPQIVIDGTPIPFTKDLGDLRDSHISSICSRVHGVLNRLRFRTYYLSSSLKKQLVAALIFPHSDYACNGFCDLSGYLDLKLMRLFNTLIRFIFRLPRDARLSPYIAKLGWLPPGKRRRYFLAVTTYQILNTSKPSYLTPFQSQLLL